MLIDNFGRSFRYLRLSLTDKCNFKCTYCLPNGYQGCSISPSLQPLQVFEIQNLVSAFAELGVEKVRLTGGEPTLRRDFIQIVNNLKTIPNLKTVALTTNGFRLHTLLGELVRSRLDALNVSLDSMTSDGFFNITQSRKHHEIKSSIEAALNIGVPIVKVNAVLLKDLNDSDEDLDLFLNWIKYKPITLRFIELMRTNDNTDYFKRHHISIDNLENKIRQRGWSTVFDFKNNQTSGPAKEFYNKDYIGKFGLISPYKKNFCDSCNRLRVTSQGKLKLCLFGENEFNLRPLIQNKNQKNQLIETILEALQIKPKNHFLNDGISGSTSSLSAIGG